MSIKCGRTLYVGLGFDSRNNTESCLLRKKDFKAVERRRRRQWNVSITGKVFSTYHTPEHDLVRVRRNVAVEYILSVLSPAEPE